MEIGVLGETVTQSGIVAPGLPVRGD